ncbi:MAG: amidase [Deltaproteobacteria bacterium]|nr:amidase [Deltaproteobacteria bacterium]
MAKTPRISGAPLRTLAASTRAAPVRSLLARVLREQLGINAVRALGDEVRGELPMSVRPIRARRSYDRPSEGLGVPTVGVWPHSSSSYVEAYGSGRVTPRQIAERALAAARDLATRSVGPVHVYDDSRALEAAAAATGRWKADRALGPLDGVPVVIKEEMAVRGLPTRLGTSFLPEDGAPADGTIVARLRAAGAVILGHSPMTEFGMSPIGVNGHRPMPRNPHDPGRAAGGSSTGSAVAVSTGLVPVALGADGGGSIRTPACLTGVLGLKPTFGLLSRSGGGLVNTVTHFGPIASTTADMARFLEAVSGEDPADELTSAAPALAPGVLVAALGRGVRGLRIGVADEEWSVAAEPIARAGRAALAALEKEGAVLVPIRMPLARHAAAIGYLTIGLEEFAGLHEVRRSHRDKLGPDLQMTLSGLEAFQPDDYLDGQRLRAGLRREVATVLGDVDVLALPTTGCAAPAITDAEARGGFLDPPVLDALCRFAFLANLTGLPAGTAPVGRDGDGLPVGLQIVADAWDDATVLQVLAHLERMEVARVVRPRVSVDLLV